VYFRVSLSDIFQVQIQKNAKRPTWLRCGSWTEYKKISFPESSFSWTGMIEWLAMPHTLSHGPVSMGSYSTVRHVPSARLAGWSSPQFCLGELICEPHGLQFNAYPLNQTGDVKTGRFIINISVNTRPRDPLAKKKDSHSFVRCCVVHWLMTHRLPPSSPVHYDVWKQNIYSHRFIPDACNGE